MIFFSICSVEEKTFSHNENIAEKIKSAANKGLSALADKTGIVSTKSKDKFCHDKFLSCLGVRIQIFKAGKFCQQH